MCIRAYAHTTDKDSKKKLKSIKITQGTVDVQPWVLLFLL